jgi:hypothetical protein
MKHVASLFYCRSLVLPFLLTANDPHNKTKAGGEACTVAYRRSAAKPYNDVIQQLALTMIHQHTTGMVNNL